MKANTKPDYELLERFIRGTLEKKEQTAVEKVLREERAWFEAHLELKEALLLNETGETISAQMREKVQTMIKRERAGFISILITIVKEKIIISSSDQSGQDFQGISAEFALRGKSDSEPGPVTITRKISGRSLTILLTPLKKKESFALSILLEKKEALSVSLVVNEIEMEKIANVSAQPAFASRLQAPCNADLVFVKKGKEEFTINLKLRSESGS